MNHREIMAARSYEMELYTQERSLLEQEEYKEKLVQLMREKIFAPGVEILSIRVGLIKSPDYRTENDKMQVGFETPQPGGLFSENVYPLDLYCTRGENNYCCNFSLQLSEYPVIADALYAFRSPLLETKTHDLQWHMRHTTNVPRSQAVIDKIF